MTLRDPSDSGLIGARVVVHPMDGSSFRDLDGCEGEIVRSEGDHVAVKLAIPNYAPHMQPTIGIRLDRLDFCDA